MSRCGEREERKRVSEPSLSPEPFRSYPYGGRQWLGRTKHGICRRGYGLRHQRVTGQSACAYCGISLVDTYDHWLMMSYDHVIPSSICKALVIPQAWVDDIINRVLACSGCNGFRNRYQPQEHFACPTNLDAFITLRDRVFADRRERILLSHKEDRQFYERRPWTIPTMR